MMEFVGRVVNGPRVGEILRWNAPIFRVPVVRSLSIGPLDHGSPKPPKYGEYRWQAPAVDRDWARTLPNAREIYARACRWHYEEVSS